MTLSRRTFAACLVGTIAAGVIGLPGLSLQSAMAQSPTDLNAQGPLGDVVLGSPDAKVTIIEYASLTCSHCAHFHEATYPTLKSKYIDTGKVRFILREFPLDPLATAGFMLARCAGNDKYYAVTDLLFDQQRNWAFNDKPLDALLQLAKQAGFTQESFEACLKDQKTYDAVNWVRDNGANKLGVNATPTFFINGKAENGAISVDRLEQILTPLVGG
ncbi:MULTISPECIES: DsbA family protein [unclassified Chelatococcus]|uniref:DsbA family protein n=1 Tax=unclassified Chelatococcus TaxID=2638111 RepID=UPI001BCE9A57|nr:MULTISPECIES: DsbA family protein [unclassified Chelatococcus]MBS7695775.1 DsbA family protein [Chelatococcus sp. YT9]MBX3555850.1 DsbA family protein [Chelatococcus sp.]